MTSLFLLVVWLMACLFAVGQMYNTYDLWVYLDDAPVAVLSLIALFAAFIGFLVAAIRIKDTEKQR